MKNYKNITFIVLIFFIFVSFAGAQEIVKSTRTAMVGNVECYLHNVEHGQTIYSISKAYSVNIEDVYKVNPGSKKGIQAGSVLYIPVTKSKEDKNYIIHHVKKGETLYTISFNYNVKVADILAANEGLTEKIKAGQEIKIPVSAKPKEEPKTSFSGNHIVKQGETLLSIARQYFLTVETLKKNNPGLSENIQIGQLIKVPVVSAIRDTIPKDTLKIYDCGKTGMQETYRIALMIPFYLDHSYSIDTAESKSYASTHKSLTFIQFYEGVKIAFDSIGKSGSSFMIYVYDVAENTDMAELLKNKLELKNMDLVIGPFFMSNFAVAAEWCMRHQIPIVNPFSKKEDAIQDNTSAFKLMPSYSAQAEKVLSFISATYPDCNITIVHRNADSLLYKAFIERAEALSGQQGIFTYNIVNYSNAGYSGLVKTLSDNKTNIIITLADGEAFVASYIRSLNELAYNNKIVLFGMPSWEQYFSLDLEYLMNLNLHIFGHSFVDYSSAATKKFIKKFREKYHTDPDYFGFQGYDIMMYFAGVIKKYGKDFSLCLNKYSPELLETGFSFIKSENGGFENTSCMIYRYENYKAVNAIQNPKKDIQLLEKKK
jgi:LysM repeat protein/ABC-type branched-subunit amino acid transport system substrate-binding protein